MSFFRARSPCLHLGIISQALSFHRCVQVFYGFGDEKLVKMIDQVKVPRNLNLNSDKVAPKVFEKVKIFDCRLPGAPGR